MARLANVRSSLLTAGLTFALLSIPFGLSRNYAVTVRFEGAVLYDGLVDGLAEPYFRLAGVISALAGVVSYTTAGWRLSAYELSKLREKHDAIAAAFAEQKIHLEDLTLAQANAAFAGVEHTEVDVFIKPNSPTAERPQRDRNQGKA